MIGRLARLWRTSPSRRLQALSFCWSRLVTATLHRSRLRRCGPGTIVRPPLFWTPENISLGADVLLWDGCRIEAIDQYGTARFSPHIVLGDGVSLQQHCHLVAAGELGIGNGTTISFGVMITDVDHDYAEAGANVLEQPLRLRPTSIGRHCFIGAGARLLAGTRLGDNCIVGANAVVRGHFGDNCVLAGVPARVVKRHDTGTGRWEAVDPKATSNHG